MSPPLPSTSEPSAGTLEIPPDDYDSPWKDISSRFFPDLVGFFAPDLHAAIDWPAGHEFLEQELREVIRDAETGPRRVDKVVKVRMKSGEPLYLILHIEIRSPASPASRSACSSTTTGSTTSSRSGW